MSYGFSKKDAKRISNTVIRVENSPLGSRTKRRKHKYRNPASNSGTSILWAKIKTVTDSKNYTADIYISRENSQADETDVKIRVWDIIDEIQIDSWIPVIPKVSQDENVEYLYECPQQIGVI